jgi:hypothetical protein
VAVLVGKGIHGKVIGRRKGIGRRLTRQKAGHIGALGISRRHRHGHGHGTVVPLPKHTAKLLGEKRKIPRMLKHGIRLSESPLPFLDGKGLF